MPRENECVVKASMPSPLRLLQEVAERYRRYLATMFHFRDPVLRRSFEEALKSENLVKGPYLEATPLFKQGLTPRQLFRELLGTQLEEGFLFAIRGDRPLYLHQEQAIRKVAAGHNVVVATGTASGKTETYLLPILLHLYREFKENRLCPGVRALVLYPMNALANDQRERLGEICARLEASGSRFHFTFGQYTGETPENERDSIRHAEEVARRRLPGELVFREEMRKEPPHILLTNYSMLEYLLLRPYDSPLFDGGRARWWTFIVLDEAHQYRGSRGMEMAMLLRRLKRRLIEGGKKEPVRSIATSATLVGGVKDKQAAANFAASLFGEPFGPDEVIIGEVEDIFVERGQGRLTVSAYRAMMEALLSNTPEGRAMIRDLAQRLGVELRNEEDLAVQVGAILLHDSRAHQLRRLITGRPTLVEEIANEVFFDYDGNRIEALDLLVQALMLARGPVPDASPGIGGPPLLSVRYHFFLKSLEGAYISYLPEKQIDLDRAKVSDGGTFEIALCRECGQHYLVGKIEPGPQKGRLVEAIRDPSHPDFGVTFFRPLDNEKFLEPENADEEDREISERQIFNLCVRCKTIWQEGLSPGCTCGMLLRLEKQKAAQEREDAISRCSVCGYQGHDPVREVVYGSDGPHAVIVTSLYQQLPVERRKILAFSDSRQEAAYFAWYLDRSYQDILSRSLILHVARKLGPYTEEGLSLQDLSDGLYRLLLEKEMVEPYVSELTVRREAMKLVCREFLTDERRISLEGVGLGWWTAKWPPWYRIPEVLLESPWNLTELEAEGLLLLLIDSMRLQGAVELSVPEPYAPLSWSELELLRPQTVVRIGSPRKRLKQLEFRSWDGPKTARVKLLKRILLMQGLSEEEAVQEAMLTLRKIWDAFAAYDEHAPLARDRFLLQVGDGRRVNSHWWRFRALNSHEVIYRCLTCGRLQPTTIKSICARATCPGLVEPVPVSRLEPNHYRSLYEANLPGKLRVEEHTAQLSWEKAWEFQKGFKEGKIHVLSCSTTFELGVDLGDLDTVFLRNVPPEPFNYVQRVGRAARRPGYPGLAVVYCRRSPHDLYHFSDPRRLMTGLTRPPVLKISNKKIILRHITAIAFSYFFKAHPERFTDVERFFGDLAHPSAVADLEAYLRENRREIENSLLDIVPEELHQELGIRDGKWISYICRFDPDDKETQFVKAEKELASDWQRLLELEEISTKKKDYRTAHWAEKRRQTIAREDVLSFLSRKAVIPKYGFPTDVVELDTQRTGHEAEEIELERDLKIAIAEFAPTSQLIANKKLWTSYGLKKLVEREWDKRFYRKCPVHGRFDVWKPGEDPPGLPCCNKITPQRQYIIPAFGFVTSREKPEEPKGRPARMFSTRPFFIGLFGPERGFTLLPPHKPLLRVSKTCPGKMGVICEGLRGSGFFVCLECGAGFLERKKSHNTPTGQHCSGKLELVSLGHEFVTDVVKIEFLRPVPGSIEPVWFAYSLAYALAISTAEVLEVPPEDLDTTIVYTDTLYVPPIIIYDNVPGGAGLVACLEDEEILWACLKAAYERVRGGCGCGEENSCYGCLRSYSNQFAHQKLQRGPVKEFLAQLLAEWSR